MKWLADTNVISELYKRRRNEKVVTWVQEREPQMALSVLSIGELRKGIAQMAAGEKRAALERHLELDVIPSFGRRILPVDLAVAERWGELLARAGRLLPILDCLLAATALHRGLTLVTRNTTDFAKTGVRIFSPWTEL